MKKIILMLGILSSISIIPQTVLQKISPALETKLTSLNPEEKILVWIYFTDKGNSIESYYSNPQLVVSEKSLQRRAKVNSENLIDYNDLPLYQQYIQSIVDNGFQVKQKSRWLNAVSGYADRNTIEHILSFSFIKSIDEVKSFKKSEDELEFNQTETEKFLNSPQPEGVHSLNYGQSYTQLNQLQVPAVHDLGFDGSGVTICVMDAGFNNLAHVAFDSMNIIAMWDFVNGDPNVGDEGDMGTGSHGTNTLSVIGGYAPGNLIGPAYRSNYILAKTENTDSETPVEEDNWVAAIEWADSIGVDVTSTSLGYLEYDPPFTSYTWQDMNGNTAVITIAADLAVKKGIVVVNSAGNEGWRSTPNSLVAPADGDSVFAIGAVDASGTRVSFSSFGPTFDGRIKPDFMAMGSNVYAARSSGTTQYTYVSGTSFSCPLSAGVVALLLQANPNLTPIQLRTILRQTSSRSNTPDNFYGWGIIRALDALNEIAVPVELTSFTANYTGNSVELTWTTSTEKNNYGFEVQKRYDGEQYQSIAFINGNGTTTNRITYNYTDKDIKSNKIYYRLKQIDYNGDESYTAEVSVDIQFPENFILYQNFPNPFNPTTSLRYAIGSRQFVTLKVYDLLGREITTLVNEEKLPGVYDIEFNASKLSSGTYFYKLQAGDYSEIKKMILLK
ncbi:Subtilisin-like serine protease [Ignavibacterium album JCM 16511]|uniref:Subtilisin-like serine protease n=1 Tax=Ignavibacterium album (strain DSM 19864 / JCM 16511 / NBRC 101810 / Mat9-16) TaxID=945713 RepID=I0AGR6_IGNAJ|nr:S8 family serine peptidase [Ignavibacterium album]AFH48173.1 Subtilisin-like serine protease [Ignavibacterium album JCM 16511]